MEAQRFPLAFLWIFTFFHLILGLPSISLENTVFVAFKGNNLSINCTLESPRNQSRDVLTCWDPHHAEIDHCDILATSHVTKCILELKNLTISGEYRCQYKTSNVYWFLQVRDTGYKENWDDPELLVFIVIIAVLLVFSVVGSVFVFRGYWKKTLSGDTSKKKKQNREEQTEREAEQDNVDAITAPSTSFYASLETRPRSIYDVLDHSATNTESDKKPKAKPKKKEPKKTAAQTTQPQQEDLECVYENF